MPRKPTIHATRAEAALRGLAAAASGKSTGTGLPLPPVRLLAARMDVSYATISRIMSRLAQEAVLWRHPNGRFYPAAARARASRALPVVVLGRQMQNWSLLYREILEGVSEVCAARGSPLVFLSSEKLVRHASPDSPPLFATEAVQRKELARLLPALPRPCGGILFDHLWSDRLIAAARQSHPSCSMLVRSSAHGTFGSASVDAAAAAELMLGHLADCRYARLLIGIPFAGDHAIDASRQALEKILARPNPPFSEVRTVDCGTPRARASLLRKLRHSSRRTALLSLEDNVTLLLWRGMEAAGIDCPGTVGLASLQGTAALGAPVTRLRLDYRRLGREAAASVLAEPLPLRTFRPVLICAQTTLQIA